jgi:PRTRC genetic system protein E
MFKTFLQMLNNDEKIQFTVTRKGSQLNVLVQPILHGSIDDKASESVQSLRAALAMPLYVTTTPEALDANFPQSLANFAGMRGSLHDDLSAAMGRIKEAGKQAKADTQNAPKSAVTASQPATATEPQPENNPVSDVPSVTSKSLF